MKEFDRLDKAKPKYLQNSKLQEAAIYQHQATKIQLTAATQSEFSTKKGISLKLAAKRCHKEAQNLTNKIIV